MSSIFDSNLNFIYVLIRPAAFPTFFPRSPIPVLPIPYYSSAKQTERSPSNIYTSNVHTPGQTPSPQAKGWHNHSDSSSNKNYISESTFHSNYFFKSHPQIQFQQILNLLLLCVVDLKYEILVIPILLVALPVRILQQTFNLFSLKIHSPLNLIKKVIGKGVDLRRQPLVRDHSCELLDFVLKRLLHTAKTAFIYL